MSSVSGQLDMTLGIPMGFISVMFIDMGRPILLVVRTISWIEPWTKWKGERMLSIGLARFLAVDAVWLFPSSSHCCNFHSVMECNLQLNRVNLSLSRYCQGTLPQQQKRNWDALHLALQSDWYLQPAELPWPSQEKTASQQHFQTSLNFLFWHHECLEIRPTSFPASTQDHPAFRHIGQRLVYFWSQYLSRFHHSLTQF